MQEGRRRAGREGRGPAGWLGQLQVGDPPPRGGVGQGGSSPNRPVLGQFPSFLVLVLRFSAARAASAASLRSGSAGRVMLSKEDKEAAKLGLAVFTVGSRQKKPNKPRQNSERVGKGTNRT